MANWYRLFVSSVLAVVLLASAPASRAQTTGPEFEFDAIGVRGDAESGQTRIDIYTRVPFAYLRFVNTGSGFAAKYEVTAEVYNLDQRNRKRNLAQSRVWEQAVPAAQFAATQSDKVFDRSMQSVELKPGRYLVEVQLRDRNSRETYVREAPILVRDMSRGVAISDLLVLTDYDARKSSITPAVANRLSTETANLSLFYEIYAKRADRVKVTRELIRLPKASTGTSMLAIFGRSNKKEEQGEVTFSKVEAAPLKVGRNQTIVEIPVAGLKAGEYMVRVKAEDDAGRALDVAEKVFSVQWDGLDSHIKDLQQAIAQLSYIAKGKDLKHIREGKTEQEKYTRFKEFWDKRDPTPGTVRNERMEEYYYRIAYANQKFGGLLDGWKTDRGHVSILFGDPDYVERHPYNFDSKPYEVWYYYRAGRQFIFIDRTGMGDYQLKEPIWDERTRIR